MNSYRQYEVVAGRIIMKTVSFWMWTAAYTILICDGVKTRLLTHK